MLWLQSLPKAYIPHEAPMIKLIYMLIAEALFEKLSYVSAWPRIVNDADNAAKTVNKRLEILKNEIIVEERTNARSEFTKREKRPDELFSEYRVALKGLGDGFIA